MKRSGIIRAACLTIGIAMFGTHAAGGLMQIRIDAGANPSPATGWNVVSGGKSNMGIAVPLKDSTGADTGVTATLGILDGNAIYWKNATTGGALGAYAGTILADGTDWRMYITNSSGYSIPMTCTLTLAGLEPESWQWYRIEMSASSAPIYWPKTQDVQVNGEWADGDHSGQGFKADTDGYNSGTILRWDEVRPDGNDLIELTVTRVGGADAYLNALVITLVPEPSTAVLLLAGGLGLAFRPRRRRGTQRGVSKPSDEP